MVQIEKRIVGVMEENCYMVCLHDRSDCVIIDPGADYKRILEMTAGKDISAILLTHGHFDHIGAVDRICEEHSTKIYVHSNDIPMLHDSTLNASWMLHDNIVCNSAVTPISGGDVIDAAGMKFSVIHTPGHTPGSVCYLTEKCLFSGDTIFPGGSYGRTDLPGGSDEEMINSLNILKPLLRKTDLYGGHGYE